VTKLVEGSSTPKEAGLKKVYGNLHQDSYITIPERVRCHCKVSLIEAFNNGINLALLDRFVKKRQKKSNNNKSKMVLSLPPNRLRKHSSRITFV